MSASAWQDDETTAIRYQTLLLEFSVEVPVVIDRLRQMLERTIEELQSRANTLPSGGVLAALTPQF